MKHILKFKRRTYNIKYREYTFLWDSEYFLRLDQRYLKFFIDYFKNKSNAILYINSEHKLIKEMAIELLKNNVTIINKKIIILDDLIKMKNVYTTNEWSIF